MPNKLVQWLGFLLALIFLSLVTLIISLLDAFFGFGWVFVPWLHVATSFGGIVCSIYILLMARFMPWKFFFYLVGAVTFFINAYQIITFFVS